MRSDFDKIRSEIINSKLVCIYRTRKPFNSFWFEGLGNLLTYKFVIEVDNGQKYQLDSHFISNWESEEKIIELETKLKNEFRNAIIVDLISDLEYDSIFIKLNNGKLIFHDDNFGSELGYEKYSEIFDINGRLI